MLRLRKIIILLLSAVFLAPAFARDHERNQQMYRQAERHYNPRAYTSLDDAVSRVRQQTRGRVLSAEERDSEYKIRIITRGGKVKRLRVDPETGEILR